MIGSSNIVVFAIKRAKYDEGFIVRLQEIAGTGGNAVISFTGKKIKKAYLTDHFERNIKEISVEDLLRFYMEPWSVYSIRVLV